MENPKVGVVFFGDSISVGDGVPVHEAWVHRVSQRLCSEFPNMVMTRNSSISGETTRQALLRMPYHIGKADDPKPKILVVQFGLNDANTWPDDYDGCRVSPDSYEGNMREILSRALSKKYGFSHVLFLASHLPKKKYPSLAKEILLRNAILRDLHYANLSSTSFVDVGANPLSRNKGNSASGVSLYEQYGLDPNLDPNILLPDGVHLNSDGHVEYFSKVYTVLHYAVNKLLSQKGEQG